MWLSMWNTWQTAVGGDKAATLARVASNSHAGRLLTEALLDMLLSLVERYSQCLDACTVEKVFRKGVHCCFHSKKAVKCCFQSRNGVHDTHGTTRAQQVTCCRHLYQQR